MSGHTPGPWRAIRDGVPRGDGSDVHARGGKQIAECGTPKGSPRRYETSTFPESDEEICANARLIAAAPDLLAFVESIVPVLECLYERLPPHFDSHKCDTHKAWVYQQEAARVIAKATGADVPPFARLSP